MWQFLHPTPSVYMIAGHLRGSAPRRCPGNTQAPEPDTVAFDGVSPVSEAARQAGVPGAGPGDLHGLLRDQASGRNPVPRRL